MILLARGVGRPDRIVHSRSIVQPAPLTEVIAAIVEYVGSGGASVHVERDGDRYRWSPAVRGGPYPLTRVVARFLDCSHYDITVGFVTVDGWCIVRAPNQSPLAEHAVLEDVPAEPAAVEHQIAQHLPSG